MNNTTKNTQELITELNKILTIKGASLDPERRDEWLLEVFRDAIEDLEAPLWTDESGAKLIDVFTVKPDFYREDIEKAFDNLLRKCKGKELSMELFPVVVVDEQEPRHTAMAYVHIPPSLIDDDIYSYIEEQVNESYDHPVHCDFGCIPLYSNCIDEKQLTDVLERWLTAYYKAQVLHMINPAKTLALLKELDTLPKDELFHWWHRVEVCYSAPLPSSVSGKQQVKLMEENPTEYYGDISEHTVSIEDIIEPYEFDPDDYLEALSFVGYVMVDEGSGGASIEIFIRFIESPDVLRAYIADFARKALLLDYDELGIELQLADTQYDTYDGEE